MIQIDPEFRSQIPPLSEDERAQLEANLLRDGCRDPLVVWGDLLLDGHNRYEMCQQHGLPFQVVAVELADRDAAADWIDTNQLGRRNLTPDQASNLRGRRYNRVVKSRGGDRRSDEFSMAQNEPLNTAEKLGAQHGVSAATIKRDGQFAAAIETLKPHVPDGETDVMSVAGEKSRQDIVEAVKDLKSCQTCGNQWLADIGYCPYCNHTPVERIQALNKEHLKQPHVSHNSGNNEWYTPSEFIVAARLAMGSIDLDPASSEVANATVGADRFFTIDEDGLSRTWHGSVWMNPPYAQPLVSQFSEAVSEKYESKEIDQACVLVNNATETAWFQRMLSTASAVCLLRGRVRFLDPSGAASGAPLQGQAVLYLGANADRFVDSFSELGQVLIKAV